MFKDLFKPPTRTEELTAAAKGLASRLKNEDYTAEEILEIHERVTIELLPHLERLKSEALIASKKASALYKASSYSLTTLRNSKESLENKPNK